MEIAITLMSMAILMTVALLVQKRHYMSRIHALQKRLDEVELHIDSDGKWK